MHHIFEKEKYSIHLRVIMFFPLISDLLAKRPFKIKLHHFV